MDTNEKKRRRPAPAAGRKPAEKPRRPRSTPEKPARPNRKPAGEPLREKPAPRRRPNPEPAEIPEVHYSMPKPFSRGKFFLKLGSAAAVVLAILACLSLFFRVDSVTVAGAKMYTPYTVQQASGIDEGDSMLGISEPRVIGKLIRTLPYIKEARIVRHLPGEVIIEITEMDVTYAVEAADGSWWLIASDGRVLEQTDETAALGYTMLRGVIADAPAVGGQITAAAVNPEPAETEEGGEAPPDTGDPDAPERLSTALAILQELEKNEIIGQMTVIDVSDLQNLSMDYGTRIHVLLGSRESLGYKIASMTSAVSQLEEYEIGELDVSFRFDEKVYFNPAG